MARSGTAIAVAAGVTAIGAAAVLAFVLTRPKPGGGDGTECPADDVAASSDGSCPAGYTPDSTSPGCCTPTTGYCVGGATPCTSNSDCSTCERCIGGCCGTLVPSSVQITSNNGGTQGEAVYTVGIPYLGGFDCDWSSLAFNGNVQQFSLSGKVVDDTGEGVPCQTLYVTFEESILTPILGTVTTDASGNFTVLYSMTGTYQGDAACPAPATYTYVNIVGVLDFKLGNGILLGQVEVTVTCKIFGVGL